MWNKKNFLARFNWDVDRAYLYTQKGSHMDVYVPTHTHTHPTRRQRRRLPTMGIWTWRSQWSLISWGNWSNIFRSPTRLPRTWFLPFGIKMGKSSRVWRYHLYRRIFRLWLRLSLYLSLSLRLEWSSRSMGRLCSRMGGDCRRWGILRGSSIALYSCVGRCSGGAWDEAGGPVCVVRMERERERDTTSTINDALPSPSHYQ